MNERLLIDVDQKPDGYELSDYDNAQMGLPQSDRWKPEGVKLARELYGKHVEETAFIVGKGPSIHKAVSRLQKKTPGSFTICLNHAIERVPGDYWMFMDLDAYRASKDVAKVVKATPLGVDRFWKYYDPDVYVWERAYTYEDLKAQRLTHRSTTLLAALHMAIWMGATRVVTVGCDNKLPPDTGAFDDRYKGIQRLTYKRINDALVNDMKFWKPSWCSIADASGGNIALPRTFLGLEIERLERAAKKIQVVE